MKNKKLFIKECQKAINMEKNKDYSHPISQIFIARDWRPSFEAPGTFTDQINKMSKVVRRIAKWMKKFSFSNDEYFKIFCS